MEEDRKTITLSLPLSTINELEEIAEEENTTIDQVLKEAVDQYFKSGKVWTQIYQWGEEAAQKLGIKSEEDVDRLIHE